MKSRLIAASLLVLVGVSANRDLFACGDKFLVVSRGSRFQRAPALRQSAAILVYANPASQLPKALSNVRVDATLRKAGYRPTSVTSAREFDQALRQGGWDLVLVDVTDTQTVNNWLPTDGAPVLLPVLYNPTGSELAQAERQYQHVLKSPTKSQSFLDAIDVALALRSGPRVKADGRPAR